MAVLDMAASTSENNGRATICATVSLTFLSVTVLVSPIPPDLLGL